MTEQQRQFAKGIVARWAKIYGWGKATVVALAFLAIAITTCVGVFILIQKIRG